jgi:hypothetical protein
MNPTQKQFSLNHVASRKQIPISFTNLRHQLSAILLVIAIQGCTYQPPKYITTADTPKLAALKGKTVALVSVAYHTNEFIGLKDIGTAGASFLLDRHSAVIQKEFGSLFRFQTSTNIHPLSLHKPPLKVSDAQQMRQLIQQLNVEAAFVVNCSYGHRFYNESDWCYLVVDTYLVDREGQVIWNFDGKASLVLTSFTDTVFDSFDREFNLESKPDGLPKSYGPAMCFMIERFTKFTGWLMEQDMAGSSKKGYGTDYPRDIQKADQAKGPFVLLPSSYDASYIPKLAGGMSSVAPK